MTRIYTRKGDDGTTATLTGRRISKGGKTIRAIGALDETIAAIGLVRVHMPVGNLRQIQIDLYDMMAQLASDEVDFGKHRTEKLEMLIDDLERHLPELRQFIIPGTSLKSALLHVARTTCRRAEQELVTLCPAELAVLTYINRLSDYLFCLARAVDDGQAETFK